jgi:hypothetical protein
MKNAKAIVTLTIGEKYLRSWKEDCEANWQEYATKHGYDLICVDQPLDTSDRANKRSPAWQKCLVLSQEFSNRYERIVWIDSDILINTSKSPSVTDDVPIDKVGAVEMFCYAKEAGSIGQEALNRMFDFWKLAVINPKAQDYYTKYGLPDGFDTVVQTGVLVMSPAYHRTILERVYYDYEEKGGPEWHYEMRPLSYELLKAEAVHWIDARFNLHWLDSKFVNYPFLITPSRSHSYLTKVSNKVAKITGSCSTITVHEACLKATFLNSYFLHIGGSEISDMKSLDTTVSSWRECRI